MNLWKKWIGFCKEHPAVPLLFTVIGFTAIGLGLIIVGYLLIVEGI